MEEARTPASQGVKAHRQARSVSGRTQEKSVPRFDARCLSVGARAWC